MDLFTAVATLAMVAFPPAYIGPPVHPGPSMQLDGIGTVYRCEEEKRNRDLTCIWVGQEAWMVQENWDRPVGSTVRVRFWLQAVELPDEDVFAVLRVEIVHGQQPYRTR